MLKRKHWCKIGAHDFDNCDHKLIVAKFTKKLIFISLLYLSGICFAVCTNEVNDATTDEQSINLDQTIVSRNERTLSDTEIDHEFSCPQECRCGKIKANRKKPDEAGSAKFIGHRVSCNGVGIQAVEDLELFKLGFTAVHLILSHNRIVVLKRGSFAFIPSLLKLDLSHNLISTLEEDAFLNLTKLQKLDLSGNKLTAINERTFHGLLSLQWLNLAENGLTSIPEGTLKYMLNSLKALDLESNPLVCDCRLKWLTLLSKKSKTFRLTQKSTCHYPNEFWGVPVSKMRRQDMHCGWPVLLSLFELIPNTDQLAFEGDAFTFQCRVADSKSNVELIWLKNGQVVDERIDSQIVTKSSNGSFDGNSLHVSSLTITALRSQHSGKWICHVITPHGNDSKSVNLMVISNNANYCPQTTTSDNKGTYEWPITLSGVTVDLPCVASGAGLGHTKSPYASYSCSSSGKWTNLNTSSCSYISEVTKVLEQFAKTNLSMSQTNNGLDSVRGLRNYTSDGSILKDKMDIVYIAITIQNYLEFVPRNKEVALVLIDVINTVMNVSPELLRASQETDNSTTKILGSLTMLSELLAEGTLNKFDDNIAVEEFIVKSDGFPGITCTSHFHGYDTLNVFWIQRKSDFRKNFVKSEKALHCSLNTIVSSRKESEANNKSNGNQSTAEAFIRLPSTLFYEVNSSSALNVSNNGPKSNYFGKLSHKLQFTVFKTAALFPKIASTINERNESDDEYVFASFVIGCRIAFTRIRYLQNPIEISLKAKYASEVDVIPVWWDEENNEWTSKGCEIVESDSSSRSIRFKCFHLGHYSLLQSKKSLQLLNLSRSPFYIIGHSSLCFGAMLSFPILLFVILLYSISFSAIQMPRKTKHSLINTWLSSSLLIAFFSAGVKQTSLLQLCRIIGLILHYLALSSILWMVITSASIYKAITSHRLAEDAECEQIRGEDDCEPSAASKPLLGHYLFGWGIAVIIVGISCAIDMNNYGSREYCFINFTSSFAIIYAPFVFLICILLIFFTLIRCLIGGRSTDVVSPRISEVESISLKSGTFKDRYWNLKTQLYLHLVYFLLFLVLLLSMCLVTIIKPFKLSRLKLFNDEIVFGLMFSIVACLISLFTLIFFCFKRNDALRIMYRFIFGCCTAKKVQRMQKVDVIRTDSVRNLDVHQSYTNINDLQQQNQSQKEMNNKPAERVDLLPKSSVDLRCIPIDGNNHPNLNFPQLITDTTNISSEQIFMNPRLNAIAKKFFEKNRRRQQMKMVEKNNLNIDVNHIFDNRHDYIDDDFLLRSPKRNNLPPNFVKAKSEIVPLGNYKAKHRHSPSSPRPHRLKSSLSAKEMNIYKSNPNVIKDLFNGGAIGGNQRNSSHHHHSSNNCRREKQMLLKSSSSIPAALQSQSTDLNDATSADKDKSESLSVCCQSDIISSASQPWYCSGRKCSRKACSHCQRQRRRRHKRYHCEECYRNKEEKAIESSAKNQSKISSTSKHEFVENSSVPYSGQRRKRRRRRMSTRSTERVREAEKLNSRCSHFPRSRSVTDKISDNNDIDCDCHLKYCSSSD